MIIHNNLFDIEKLFCDFLLSHNHPLNGNINHDGNIFHCFKCPNGSATDARYKLYRNGFGYLKCWKCSIDAKFYAKRHNSTVTQSPQYVAHTNKQPTPAILEQHAKQAAIAKTIFESASEPGGHEHPYIRFKQVRSYGLRALTHENKITKEINCYRGTLLIPCFNTYNNLVSIERVYFSKSTNKFEKRPLKGAERSGVFYLIGSITASTNVIVITEGYATAASIYEATHYPTFVAFNCTNLTNVAIKVRNQNRNAKIIVAADIDNDKHGEIYARKASLLINGIYLLPNFATIPHTIRPDIKRSDFNDLFVLLMANGLNRTAALSKVQQQIQ